MKIASPVGPATFGPLFVRLAIGTYFVMAGMEKIDKIPAFVSQVGSFGILPDQLATLYGILLPYTEFVVGIMLILGIWTTLSALLASLMLISFIIAFGVIPNAHMVFNKDLILLASALSLMYTGPGIYSVDGSGK